MQGIIYLSIGIIVLFIEYIAYFVDKKGAQTCAPRGRTTNQGAPHATK